MEFVYILIGVLFYFIFQINKTLKKKDFTPFSCNISLNVIPILKIAGYTDVHIQNAREALGISEDVKRETQLAEEFSEKLPRGDYILDDLNYYFFRPISFTFLSITSDGEYIKYDDVHKNYLISPDRLVRIDFFKGLDIPKGQIEAYNLHYSYLYIREIGSLSLEIGLLNKDKNSIGWKDNFRNKDNYKVLGSIPYSFLSGDNDTGANKILEQFKFKKDSFFDEHWGIDYNSIENENMHVTYGYIQ